MTEPTPGPVEEPDDSADDQPKLTAEEWAYIAAVTKDAD